MKVNVLDDVTTVAEDFFFQIFFEIPRMLGVNPADVATSTLYEVKRLLNDYYNDALMEEEKEE